MYYFSMPRPNHFAIPAEDPHRAQEFYRHVFNWKFELAWEYDTPTGREGYWRASTGSGSESGIDGGITKREYPGQPIAVGIQVPSVEEYAARVEKYGGKIIVGRMQLPDGTFFAFCQDSEGNSFAIVESAASA